MFCDKSEWTFSGKYQDRLGVSTVTSTKTKTYARLTIKIKNDRNNVVCMMSSIHKALDFRYCQ